MINLVACAGAPFGAAALSLGVLQAVRGAGTGLGPAIASALLRRGRSGEVLGRIGNGPHAHRAREGSSRSPRPARGSPAGAP